VFKNYNTIYHHYEFCLADYFSMLIVYTNRTTFIGLFAELVPVTILKRPAYNVLEISHRNLMFNIIFQN